MLMQRRLCVFACNFLLLQRVPADEGVDSCSNGEGASIDFVQGATATKSDCGCSNLNRPSGSGSLHVDEVASSVEVKSTELGALSEAARAHNKEMVDLPPGFFLMGAPKDKVYFEIDGEGPLRSVRMSGFRMDKYEVSNAKFRDFVAETGYRTEAEKYGDSFVAEVYLSEAVSGSIDKKVAAVPWWLPVPNASWLRPEGIDSGLEPPMSRFGDRWNHPVVHMAWKDADAYCRWRNASLPTEAQWEYAARGGESNASSYYPWGDDRHGAPKRHRMNIWQGKFPTENSAKDGYIKTAPVDAYGKQNKWGLYNMLGNAWEWVSDWFSPVHFLTDETKDLGFIDPEGPTLDELEEIEKMGHLKRDASGQFEKVKKGGSFMCHKSYCFRYRICARSKLITDSSAHHTGFRCAQRASDQEASHWSRAVENPDRSRAQGESEMFKGKADTETRQTV